MRKEVEKKCQLFRMLFKPIYRWELEKSESLTEM